MSGRPDCPFCGADDAAAAAAAPSVQPDAPAPWLPAAPAALTDPPRSSEPTRTTFAGVAVAVLILVGLFAWGPDLGSKGTPDRAAGSGDPVAALLSACREAKPINEAAPFKPTPGRHRLEGMVLWKQGLIEQGDTERLELDEGWNSPELDGDVKLDELQLVACYTANTATVTEKCQMRATSGTVSDLPIVQTTGTLVIREARTGKEVLRKALGARAGVTCDELYLASGPRLVVHPMQDISAILRLYNDGTEPGLPMREQAAQLCEGELERAVLPEARPLDAVAVFTQPNDEMPFEPLTKDSKHALPPEVNVVPPEDAGTVLCITDNPAETAEDESTRAVAYTLATGEQGELTSFRGEGLGTDGQGRRVLTWTNADGGLQQALTGPRTLES